MVLFIHSAGRIIISDVYIVFQRVVEQSQFPPPKKEKLDSSVEHKNVIFFFPPLIVWTNGTAKRCHAAGLAGASAVERRWQIRASETIGGWNISQRAPGTDGLSTTHNQAHIRQFRCLFKQPLFQVGCIRRYSQVKTPGWWVVFLVQRKRNTGYLSNTGRLVITFSDYSLQKKNQAEYQQSC